MPVRRAERCGIDRDLGRADGLAVERAGVLRRERHRLRVGDRSGRTGDGLRDRQGAHLEDVPHRARVILSGCDREQAVRHGDRARRRGARPRTLLRVAGDACRSVGCLGQPVRARPYLLRSDLRVRRRVVLAGLPAARHRRRDGRKHRRCRHGPVVRGRESARLTGGGDLLDQRQSGGDVVIGDAAGGGLTGGSGDHDISQPRPVGIGSVSVRHSTLIA